MNEATKISEAEWKVCQALWRHSPQTANEIVEALADSTTWNPRTIKTLLNRLVKKNVVDYENHGREYRYFPRLTEDECVQAQTNSFVKRVFGGAVGTMVATFINSGQLTEREIAELKKILAQKSGKK